LGILEISWNWVKAGWFLPDIGINHRRSVRERPWHIGSNREIRRGYRAEVRRERKKRDILSPVNVLHIRPV
jgi:hypothetical protein